MGSRKQVRPTAPPSGPALVRPAVGVLLLSLGGAVDLGCASSRAKPALGPDPPMVEVEPPMVEPPMDEPPVDEPPMDVPPMDEPPMVESPMDDPPMDEPPMDEPPMSASSDRTRGR